MPVFPDDVGRLTGIVHIDDGSEECSVMSIVILENGIVIQFTSAFSFLSFKGQETVDGRLHLIK
jgi:hypothetical protein